MGTATRTAFDRLRELEVLAERFPAATAWWDDVPCGARRCLVVVQDPGGSGRLWYRSLIGQTCLAVEVIVPDGVSGKAPGRPGQRVYIDDTDGWGWAKVTQRFGGREVVSGVFHSVRVLDYLDDA